MLTIYRIEAGRWQSGPPGPDPSPPEGAVWLDLADPAPAETAWVEAAYGVDVPTQAEMREIEVSSRLHREDGTLYLTANFLTKADTEEPVASAITFILTARTLITLRYVDPKPFRWVAERAQRRPEAHQRGEAILVDLLDAFIERTADVLEDVGLGLDGISREIFRDAALGSGQAQNVDLRQILRRIGRQQDLTAKARESLVTIQRLVTFLAEPGQGFGDKASRARLKTLARDVRSLADHAGYLSGNITFQLDTVLGLINIEQNGIIKIFSVAAVIFLPPTVVASIYGMNFDLMPELHWRLGYPLALGLMVASAAVTYWFFKRRGWL